MTVDGRAGRFELSNVVANTRTACSDEEVIAGAQRFFAAEHWRETRRTHRSVTFRGRPQIPWLVMLLIAVALLAYVVPGVVIYLLCVRHACRFTSIVVETASVRGGTDVVVHCPVLAEGVARRFVSQLPPMEMRTRPRHSTRPLPELQMRLTGSGRA